MNMDVLAMIWMSDVRPHAVRLPWPREEWKASEFRSGRWVGGRQPTWISARGRSTPQLGVQINGCMSENGSMLLKRSCVIIGEARCRAPEGTRG
jgi:hypothetical protein